MELKRLPMFRFHLYCCWFHCQRWSLQCHSGGFFVFYYSNCQSHRRTIYQYLFQNRVHKWYPVTRCMTAPHIGRCCTLSMANRQIQQSFRREYCMYQEGRICMLSSCRIDQRDKYNCNSDCERVLGDILVVADNSFVLLLLVLKIKRLCPDHLATHSVLVLQLF